MVLALAAGLFWGRRADGSLQPRAQIQAHGLSQGGRFQLKRRKCFLPVCAFSTVGSGLW